MKRFLYKQTLIKVMMLCVVTGCTQRSVNPGPTLTAIAFPAATITTPALLPNTETPQIELTPTLTLTSTSTETPSLTPLPPPTNTVCSPPSGWPTYTVQPGENLFRIALSYDMSTEDLQSANCISSADTIYAGQTIYVPYLIPPTTVPQQSTNSEIPVGVKGKVSLDTGGAIESPDCPPPTQGIAQEILIAQPSKDTYAQDMYALCIYGFPKDEEITVGLYAPDEHAVDTQNFPGSGQINGHTLLKIPLWMPVGVPTGFWSATAESASVPKIENQSLSISSIAVPAINSVPVGEINPFQVEKNCDIDQGHGVYSPGQNLIINGTNFGSNPDLVVGIYLLTWDFPEDESRHYVLSLISAQRPIVNQGSFSIPITIQATDPAGIYWIFPILDPNEPIYKSFDAKSDCYQVP